MKNLVNNGSKVQELFRHYFTDSESKFLYLFSLEGNNLKMEVTLNDEPVMMEEGTMFIEVNNRIIWNEKFVINYSKLDKNIISFEYKGNSIELRKV